MPGESRRRYPERPLLGVGAILLAPGDGEVLLIERGTPPSEGKWSFPGGLVEAGETVRAACARELLEETGLEAELVDAARIVERILPDDAERVEYHFVIVDLWGRARGGRPEPRPGSDVTDARWVRIEEVSALETTRGVVAALERALLLARGETPATPLFET
jgi:8-oxo-dGTP diphosphatase